MIRMRISITTFFVILIMLSTVQVRAEQERPVWWNDVQKEADRYGYKLLDGPGVEKKLKEVPGIMLLDVRAEYEFEGGHIPGALNMEFELGEDQYFSKERERQLRELLGPDLNRPVIIYCRSFR